MRKLANLTDKELLQYQKENTINICLKYLVQQQKLILLVDCRTICFFWQKRDFQDDIICYCVGDSTNHIRNIIYDYYTEFTTNELIIKGIPILIKYMQDQIEWAQYFESKAKEKYQNINLKYKTIYNKACEDIMSALAEKTTDFLEKLKK